MQVHVCAGCDYLSIFYGFGNVLFWQQYMSTVNLFAHTETALGILANRTNSTFIFQIIECAQLRYHKSLIKPLNVSIASLVCMLHVVNKMAEVTARKTVSLSPSYKFF